jgi:hypothetical protein
MSKSLKRPGLCVKNEIRIVSINHHQEQRLTWTLEIPCWTLDIY